MAVFFVTGKLGGGKTLVSVGKIQEYLLAGKKVATNLDINLEYLISRTDKKCEIYRIPDKPNINDLDLIGRGTDSKHDEDFGLLVLDELGTWLNSRTYQKDKGRQDVIDWFLHCRHLGWDVLLIVQDPDLIDKQIRISLGEHVVFCRRTDRISIPVLGTLIKIFTGKKPKLPRVHVGSVFYGSGRGAIKTDTWIYRGVKLFPAYDTSQIFKDSKNGVSRFLPPFFLNNKRFAKKNMRFYMRITKIYWKRFSSPVAFFLGLILNFIFLFVLLGFSGNPSISSPVPTGDGSAAGEKSRDISKKLKIDRPTVETKLVKIPFGEVFIGEKKVLKLFYEGEMFSVKGFPGDLVWRSGKPFLRVPVESKVLRSSSKTSSLISNFIE